MDKQSARRTFGAGMIPRPKNARDTLLILDGSGLGVNSDYLRTQIPCRNRLAIAPTPIPARAGGKIRPRPLPSHSLHRQPRPTIETFFAKLVRMGKISAASNPFGVVRTRLEKESC